MYYQVETLFIVVLLGIEYYKFKKRIHSIETIKLEDISSSLQTGDIIFYRYDNWKQNKFITCFIMNTCQTCLSTIYTHCSVVIKINGIPFLYTAHHKPEYDYITKEYGLDVTAKRDIKSGYSVKEIPTSLANANSRSAELQELYREGETKPCAIIMIYKKMGYSRSYYCIPTANASSRLWAKFLKSLNKDDTNSELMLHVMTYSLAKGLAQSQL